MSSNISGPLQKKSDNPSEKVPKTNEYLDETEKAFVTTTDTITKKENTDMGTKPNVVKEDITLPISNNNIDTVKSILKDPIQFLQK